MGRSLGSKPEKDRKFVTDIFVNIQRLWVVKRVTTAEAEGWGRVQVVGFQVSNEEDCTFPSNAIDY